ncbi:hypothetical protein ACFQZI_03790 [Mucilaginibacter lutimaris]|uniref:Lipocalin-like domain-containing protein n=1 Tax=Mucilaginibacter lutimaris TaxID=931629 RepID=A0ABW2ZC24_9SPHI
MKLKSLLLILCFSVVLFGCKKDESPEDRLADAKSQIIGTWAVQSTTITYYDASGKVIDTDNSDSNKGETFQFINSTSLKASGSSDDTYAYNMTNVNNKIMLNVANQSFEVVFNGSSTMTWTVEEMDNGGTDYAKAVTVIQFKKI